MFLIIGFCSMLSLYLIAITTLMVLTIKQGLQDKKVVDVSTMTRI